MTAIEALRKAAQGGCHGLRISQQQHDAVVVGVEVKLPDYDFGPAVWWDVDVAEPDVGKHTSLLLAISLALNWWHEQHSAENAQAIKALKTLREETVLKEKAVEKEMRGAKNENPA